MTRIILDSTSKEDDGHYAYREAITNAIDAIDTELWKINQQVSNLRPARKKKKNIYIYIYIN